MGDIRKIYFLLNKNFHLLDLAGPAQALQEAILLGANFEINYIGFSDKINSAQNLKVINIDPPPTVIEDNSIVIVTASQYKDVIFKDPESILSAKWLNSIYNPNITLIGICTGCFLIAQSGLLDHKKCTTHHSLTNILQKKYPQLQVVPDQIFVQDTNIFTTAGVTAGIDLILYLLEKYFNLNLSLQVARDLVVYRRRMSNDSQHSTHIQYRNHISPLIHKVQDYISKNYTQNINQSQLAEDHNISLRHLQRSFKIFSGITIHKYINLIRLEEAKSLIENGYKTEYAAYLTGFPNTSSLRKLLNKSNI